MSQTEVMGVASRLHVLLRRKANRITDIVWMSVNVDYAREILRLARVDADAEMQALVARFEELMPGAADPQQRAQAARDQEQAAHPPRYYIGSLR